MPGYEDEIKLLDTAWETRISTCAFPADMCMAMVDIRDIIENCNDALTRAGLAAVPYSPDAGYQELIRITNNIVKLNDYITKVRADLGSAIDDPLFYAFNQKGKATELLSLIHMEDFQTANTVNVETITSYDGNIGTTTKPTIGFSDFIGSGGEVNPAAPVTQTVCVQEFNDLFAQTYELSKKYGNLSEDDVKSLKDYQNLLLTSTEFDHKKEQPFLDLLSGLVDILIITQFLKAAAGYDPITDEDLTDQERNMLVISGSVQVLLLGVGFGSELMAKAAVVDAKVIAGEGKVIAGEGLAGEAIAGEKVIIIGEGAAAEGGTDDFVGMLKGEKVTLPNVKGQTIQYTKVSTENLAELRKAFNTTDRKEFLKFLSNDDNMLEQLNKAGLTDTDILKMKDGYVPTGYQVHHKIPLDGGGTNSFDNLVLIKNDPYHKVITNSQNSVTSGLDAGQTMIIDNWPIPDGYIYPKE